MRETDRAWAAGFIDGEGCLDVHRNLASRQRHMPRITVGNTNLAALKKLQGIFGGSVYQRCKGKGEHRPVYAWSVQGAKGVREVLDAIQPYLVVKKAEAGVLADLILTYGSGGRKLTDSELAYREQATARLRELKRSA